MRVGAMRRCPSSAGSARVPQGEEDTIVCDHHQHHYPDHRRDHRRQCRWLGDEEPQPGAAGNTIAGALGGLGGGQLLELIIPALQGAAGGGPDLGSVIGQLVGGGAGGAILTAIIGAIKNAMNKQA